MRLGVTLALIGSVLGCSSGTETGNPTLNASLSFSAHSSEPAAVSVRGSSGAVRVSSVWLSLGPVTLVEGESCAGDGGRFESDALGVGDHAGDTQAHTEVSSEPGPYCALELSLTPAREVPDGAPSELAGRSLAIVGELADGSPLLLVSSLERTLTVPAIGANFALKAGDSAMLLGFDVAAWLASLELGALPREADGSVLVDATHSPETLRNFEAQLPSGLELYRDRDADGQLDENPELLARGAP